MAPTPADTVESFWLVPVEPSLVASLLMELDIRKSTDPNGLSARFLQWVAEEIAEPLTFVYNKSLSTKSVPVAWKKSNATPIHKGRAIDDPGNYCPISVVPIVAKITKDHCFPIEFVSEKSSCAA